MTTAYSDDVIIFNENLNSHVLSIREFFQRRHKYNFKPSPAKSQLGAIEVNFLGHSTSPSGIGPNALKVAALAEIPVPDDINCSILGGLSYHRKFLLSLVIQVWPLNFLLKEGTTFEFTPKMDNLVSALLAKISAELVLAYPDWDAAGDDACLFRLCCDACISGFGAALKQDQVGFTVRPIVHISRATLPT